MRITTDQLLEKITINIGITIEVSRHLMGPLVATYLITKYDDKKILWVEQLSCNNSFWISEARFKRDYANSTWSITNYLN